MLPRAMICFYSSQKLQYTFYVNKGSGVPGVSSLFKPISENPLIFENLSTSRMNINSIIYDSILKYKLLLILF